MKDYFRCKETVKFLMRSKILFSLKKSTKEYFMRSLGFVDSKMEDDHVTFDLGNWIKA